ncbi:phage tail protein [Maribellus sp. CM-23]|uniref:phage tail protein n=1 Tax=Maribellus sp. CM-23 TaxID=2781026 RepID=UPI001F31DFD9|nr:tail fiber protein [Maribellus sp. CM-23]MCE4564242.1 phage tail protein [Maribellus sp. CM-23]
MEPFIGQIQAFGFNFAPRGWAFCDGQLLPIASYTALFSLLGTTFGGDGRNTFALPDLRGRTIVHPGHGPGLSTVNWGQKSGVEQVTLTTLNMPSHNHNSSVIVNTGSGEASSPTGYLAAHAGAYAEDPTSGANLAGVSNLSAGGSQPFNIRNPFVGIYTSIALVGIFPSRN